MKEGRNRRGNVRSGRSGQRWHYGVKEAASAGAGTRERRRVGAGAGYDGGVELSRGEEKTAGEGGKRGNVGRGKKSS